VTPRHPQLDQLQHWLLAAIADPEQPCPDDLNSLILPSRQQSSAQRLAVYRQAYVARLLEVLREQFPCTRFAIGDELFDQFATGYLRRYPPTSYTLGHLADQLAEYLDATRPADWGEFIVELAQLERAIDRSFDAPGPENLPPFALPADANASLKLSLVPGFELLAFRYPTSSYYTQWKAGCQPGWPAPAEQFVALLRRDYIVRRYELSAPQFKLLSSLQAGFSVGEALVAVTEAEPIPFEELTTRIQQWFTNWAKERFFAAAEEAFPPP
jgi:Putative DNA-binding domain